MFSFRNFFINHLGNFSSMRREFFDQGSCVGPEEAVVSGGGNVV